LDGVVTEFRDLLDELRCWETNRLHRERDRVVCEKRKLEARELALTKVLDERRALGADLAARDGVSEATARRNLETARKLETLPAVADAALAGRFSAEQLAPTTGIADESTDAEWAERGAGASPLDLQRMARQVRTPTPEEFMARRKARSLRKWVDHDHGMLCGRFEIPLEHGGQLVDQFFDAVTERMRPAKGQAWDSLEQRQADVLVGLCELETAADGRDPEDRVVEPTLAARPTLNVDVPLEGPATLGGVPLPDEWVESLRAEARVQLRAVDEAGAPVAEAPAKKFVSDKRRRAVLRRDGRCRVPGCARRQRLHVHHLQPASWGGSDDMSNLAAVCPAHHTLLVPHGELVLEGNPSLPDGLRLRRLTPEEFRRRHSPSAA
jgi:hypothetical protein